MTIDVKLVQEMKIEAIREHLSLSRLTELLYRDYLKEKRGTKE